MSFLNLPALLWLLFAIPAIVVLYLLKLKRRDRVVPSVLLWARLVKDVQANAPFQKLRRNLLLLIQILLAILLAGSLARPFVRVHALGGKNMAIIVDGSASMRSTDVAGTRFEEARRMARRMVDGMGRGDTAMVILATSRAHALCSPTDDQNVLRRSLDGMRPADSTTNLQDAISLAASLIGQRKEAEIYLLSDGAFETLDSGASLAAPVRLGNAQLRFVKIGKRGDNVGVTALDVRKSLAGEFDYQVFTQVQNFSAAEKQFTLELYRNESLIDAREVTLAAGKTHGEAFGIQGSVAGPLTVKIDLADDLAADNSATVMLEPRKRINVLLVTAGNLFLEKALNVDPRVSLSKAAPGSSVGVTAPKYDVVVLDGKAPDDLPAKGRYLFIGAGGDVAPVEVTGQVEHPSFLDWERRHPVTRFLDLGSVQIARGLTVKALPWGQPLAESEKGPLIVAGEKEGLRSIFVGFNLLESDLPMRVAFPIFLSNCMDWLMGSGGAAASAKARTGDVVAQELPADVRRVEITYPDGSHKSRSVEQSPLLFADTEQAGVYQVEGRGKKGTFRARFAANLLSEEESNTRPQERVRFGSTSVAATDTASQKVPREIWRWVALLALCLLAFEWYAYHRRL